MNRKKMGGFLKCLRKEKGLTQEQLAEEFGLSVRTVSRWETGSNVPDVETLMTLADFYRVDIRELIDGERNSKPLSPNSKESLKIVAAYAAEEENRTRSLAVYWALGMCAAILIASRLFGPETKGLLYGIVPPELCSSILFLVYGASAVLLVAWLRALFWQEKPATGPRKTVQATVVSKEIRPGTHGAGRSKGGFSYVLHFLTLDGQPLELYAFEVEFGSLEVGMQGLLTYRDTYFLRFHTSSCQNG